MKHDHRSCLKDLNAGLLISGALSGALLCVFITLGMELRACGGLGFSWGQRLMRFVPLCLLCMPLCCGFFILLGREGRSPAPAQRPRLLPLAALFFVCYIPALLAYCPGILAYDATSQVKQGILHAYSTHHPLVHTYILSLCMRIGAAIHSYTLGAGLYTLLQMSLLSLLFACVCRELASLGASRCALRLAVAFYALYPVNAIMAISSTKDTLFAGLLTLLLVRTAVLLREGRPFLRRRGDIAGYVLLAALTCLWRNNGVYAFLFFALCTVLCFRGLRMRLAALFAACVIVYGGAQAVLVRALDATQGSRLEMLCIPIQQLARVASRHGNELDSATRDALSVYMPVGEENPYTPYLADSVKMKTDGDAFKRDPLPFFELWIKLGLAYPEAYIDAALLLNQGMWDPLDTSTGHIYDVWDLEQHGYLQTRFQRHISDENGIVVGQRSLLPAVQTLYERLCTQNVHQNHPLTNLLFSPGAALWLCLLLLAFFIARGRRAYACAACLLVGLTLTHLLGPCALTRYAYPLFTCAPVLLTLARIKTDGGKSAQAS